MHPRIYREFDRICRRRNAGGSVLEIGAVPDESSLLNLSSLRKASSKVGINLEGPSAFKDFEIVKGDANSMTMFGDNRFDTVLCNAVLEHDRFFWKTLSEIRRVTKPGGLVVIGTPGYTRYWIENLSYLIGRIPFACRYAGFLFETTLTSHIHQGPGDYYRFSPQAFREVFFDGIDDVEVRRIMVPPRIIGSGRKPQTPPGPNTL